MKIILCKNAFSVRDREIIPVPLKKSVRFYTIAKKQGLLDGNPYTIHHAGKIYHTKKEWRTLDVLPGDIVTVVLRPRGGGNGGKQILSIIGAIALSVASMGAGAALAVKGVWTVGSYIAAAAVSYLGGALLQRLTPKPKTDSAKIEDNRYLWNLGGMNVQQGGAVPVIYGTIRPQLTLLHQHVISSGTQQYLQMLLCPCEGPIDEIRDIRINKNPIAYYKDVVVETRLGTNTQEIIENINESYADQTLGYDLTTNWSTYQTEGNGGEGLEITLEFPAGLYYSNDKGGSSATTVVIVAEYRLEGASTWSSLGSWTITENQTQGFRKVYRKDNLEKGRYVVRVRCASKSGESIRYLNKIYWSQLTHVYYKKFAHPNKALLAIKALATDQISGGTPEITCEVVRSKVWVYNPYTGVYEQEAATNPAWVAYDIWHRAEKMQHPRTRQWEFIRRGIPKEYMIYDDFKAWADKCDENKLEINIAFNLAQKKPDAVASAALVGRGNAITRGTKVGAVFDAPAEMGQIFTMGNIKAGSFKQKFLSLTDRANVIELSYYDKERNYQSETVRSYSQGWEKIKGINNPTQIRYEGITSREQACREAAYQGRKNKYEICIINFDVLYEAISCQVGDVVGVQHELPDIGTGGRIVSATETTVTLDNKVFLEPGKEYGILIRLIDDTVISRDVVTDIEIETDVLTISEPFDVPPDQNDVWAFGIKNKAVRPFRVLDISRRGASWTERTIALVEYIKEVYIDGETVPEIDYTNEHAPIRGLMATGVISLEGIYYVDLSWLPARERYSSVRLFANGKQIADLPGESTNYRWQPTTWGDVEYSASAIDLFGNTTSSSKIIFATVKPLPDDVPSFSVTFVGQTKQFVFDWSVPEGINPIDGYEIRRGQAWEAGQAVKRVDGKQIIRDSIIAIRGKSKFWLCAYNKYGYSPNAIAFDVDVEQMPGRDVVDTIFDYEETGEVTGYGELLGGSLVQWSGMTVGYVKIHTWGELKDKDWLSGCMGPVSVIGKVIDIGKAASIVVWPDEVWSQVPDRPSSWEYQSSFDNVIFSDWRALPTTEIEGRYFRFRVSLQGANRAGILRSGNLIIDVPENTIKLPGVEIPLSGVYVSFIPGFVRSPTIQVTPNNAALIVEKTQISGAGCYIKLYKNEYGKLDGEYAAYLLAVEGLADIFATGF